MSLFVTVDRRIVDYKKCPVVAVYEDSILGKYNLELAVKQRDEKLREEYEAFIDMYNADGIYTASSRSREL